MNDFINTLQSLIPSDFDLLSFLKALAILVVGFLVIGVLGRLIFGRKSVLNQSVSAAIGILFIYAVTIIVHSYGIALDFLVSPLPFVSISGDYLSIFNIASGGYVSICGHVLNMIILAFLVNLVNSWMPAGKKLIGWLFFRCLSVALAMLLHTLVNHLLTASLPDGLLLWAPVILLGLLILMLAVGALKFVIGALLSTVNPLIGFLYTFFFANAVGKQLSKAMLTTLLFSALVYALNHAGITAVYVGSAALIAYLPLLILLLLLWFIIGRKL